MPVFGADTARAHQAELWEGLKVEVLYTSSDDSEQAALETLRVFLRVLIEAERSTGEVESEFLEEVILGEMEMTLREPEKSQAAQIVKILTAAFGASREYLSCFASS